MSCIHIIGNLTADPVLKNPGTDKQYCYFTLADNSGYGDKKRTDFHNCVAFRKNAENIAKYQKKGNMLYVRGEMESYTKEGEEINGYKVWRWKVNVEDCKFLTPADKSAQGNPANPPAGSQDKPPANPPANNYRRGQQPPPKDMEETDEDMPF